MSPNREVLVAPVVPNAPPFEFPPGNAYAIILFVTVFGLASIYVKALNKVKER